MKHKYILLFEDSSKVGFGGGQNISLQVLRMFMTDHREIYVADFADNTRFALAAKQELENDKFIVLNNEFPFRIGGSLKNIWEFCTLKSYAIRNANKIVNRIGSHDIIVYATTRRALINAYELNKKYGVKYVYHAHLVENRSSIKYRIIFKALQKAELIICTSNVVSESINMPNKVVLYNPAPLASYKSVPKIKNKTVVATIGSLIPIKGLNYFIESAKLLSNYPDIEFRIYGEGPLKTKLQKQADDKVLFMGFCTDVIRELSCQIDIFVLPTIVAEALPTTIIEAKQAGVPVITTNIGGQAEIVEHNVNGLLIDIADEKALAAAILDLFSNKDLYDRMSVNSKNSSSVFDRSIFENKIRMIFDTK